MSTGARERPDAGTSGATGPTRTGRAEQDPALTTEPAHAAISADGLGRRVAKPTGATGTTEADQSRTTAAGTPGPANAARRQNGLPDAGGRRHPAGSAGATGTSVAVEQACPSTVAAVSAAGTHKPG